MSDYKNSADMKNTIILAKPLFLTKTGDFENFRNLLNQTCDRIAQSFDLYTSSRKPRKAAIIDAIVESACLGCVAKKLSEQTAAKDVDALYKECHRLAVNALVEELYVLLNQTGYKVLISTEAKLEYGKADILITVTNYGLNLKGKTKEILIEVKTGNSISLSQLFRYLLDSRSDTIVVWRIRKRQVLVFNAQNIKPLLTEFTRIICLRGVRLLSSPQLQQCQHVKQSNYLPTQEELQKMFKDFAEALVETLPNALETIITNLEIRTSNNRPMYTSANQAKDSNKNNNFTRSEK